MKRGVVFIFLLLCLSVVSAADLGDYPMFNGPIDVVAGGNADGLVQMASVNLMFTLGQYDKKDISQRLDYEISDYSGDFLLLGGPCENEVTEHFFPGQGCNLDGSGVYYVENGNSHVVVFLASTVDDLIELSEDVRYGRVSLSGDSYVVDSVVDVEAPVSEDVAEVVYEEPVCEGCLVEGVCLSLGDVTSVQGVGHFCDGDNLLLQKEVGACSLDAECLLGTCLDGQCGPVVEESGFFGNIWEWITGWFVKT